jgi:hypothetical protein
VLRRENSTRAAYWVGAPRLLAAAGRPAVAEPLPRSGLWQEPAWTGHQLACDCGATLCAAIIYALHRRTE